MSSRIGVVPRHFVVTSVAILFAICLLGSFASAQVASYQPKDEVFGGYSWIHPNGYVDYGYKLHDISKGFDISNVWYLPAAHNWGLMLDSSAHFDGDNDTDLGYIFGGLQYKYHTDTISPFARVGFGTAKISPPTYIDEWKPAIMGGGGLDWALNHKWSIRLAQIDYIYTNYDALLPTHGTQFNTIRLAAGVVYNIGNYYLPALECGLHRDSGRSDGRRTGLGHRDRHQFQSQAHVDLRLDHQWRQDGYRQCSVRED